MTFFKKFITKRQKQLNQKRQANREALFLKIRDVVAGELHIEDKDQIKPNTRFKEDLNVDSLDSIELIMGLENAFNLEIDDESAEKMLTIQDVIDYLEKKV
jgi:acyl carrier protein